MVQGRRSIGLAALETLCKDAVGGLTVIAIATVTRIGGLLSRTGRP